MRKSNTISLMACLLMIGLNGYLQAIRFGGTTVGEVAFSYPNLFQPMSLTFSIWGLIYTLLVIFHVLELNAPKLSDKSHGVLILIHLANVLWLMSWQANLILVSTLVMFVLLGLLTYITKYANTPLARTTLNIYFGWITVASVANVTILLVSMNVSLSVLPESVWLVIVLLIVSDLTLFITYIRRSLAYLSVILWAYVGILIRHVDTFNALYKNVIVTLVLVMLGAIGMTIYIVYSHKEGSYGKLE